MTVINRLIKKAKGSRRGLKPLIAERLYWRSKKTILGEIDWKEILTGIQDGIIAINTEGKVVYWNQGAERLYGFSEQEMLGNTMSKLQADYDFNETAKHFAKNQYKPFRYQWSYKNGEGLTRTVDVTMSVIFSGAVVSAYMGVSKDITDQKKLETKLQQLTTELEMAIKAARLGVWVLDLESGRLDWNHEMHEHYGISEEDWRHQLEDWQSTVDPDDFMEANKSLQSVFDGNEVHDIHFKIKRPSDGEVRMIKGSAAPLYDSDQKLRAIMGINSDITLYLKNEEDLTKSIEDLKANQGDMDHFAYSVAHDLRAPIASCLGLITLLKDVKMEDSGSQLTELLNQSVEQFDATTREMIDYFQNKNSGVSLSFFDVNKEIENALKNLSFHKNFKRIDLRRVLKGESKLYSDVRLFKIILNNLLSNSVKYIDENKANCFAKIGIEVNDKSYKLSVSDNGMGIEKEHQERIFDIFYRASNKGYGSGLGLYILKQAVDKLGGTLSFRSEVGVGSSFEVSIPLAAEE